MSTKPVVLLLEDHTELGEVIRDLMAADGYDVIAVRDQGAALGTLRAQSVDLVIADLPS
ncbi:MAG: two-component system response regulator, partial [Gemmatimonadetes bacterium]|nr:two-component system response regulator [Gemmatimonadota bacterium]